MTRSPTLKDVVALTLAPQPESLMAVRDGESFQLWRRRLLNTSKEFSAVTWPGPANAKEYNALPEPEKRRFSASKQKEDDALIRRDTYDLVERQQAEAEVEDGKAVWRRSRYVFNDKEDSDGNRNAKTRHVVQDYRTGAPEKENYAPVARRETLNVVAALGAQLKMRMRQIDYDNAFLHAKLEGKTVYVEFPKGFKVPAGAEGKVMKLNKSLYGLQCAPRLWYEEVCRWMESCGWSVSLMEPCLFFRKTPSGGMMLFSMHVDDKFGGTTQHPDDLVWFEDFIKKVGKKYGVKDLGTPRYVLGIDVTHDEKTGETWHSQHTYIKKSLKEFGFDSGHATEAAERNRQTKDKLMDKALRMDRRQREEDEEKRRKRGHTAELYRQMVGTLLHATHTRPDIAHAVGMLGRMLELDGEEAPAPVFKTVKERLGWEKRRDEKIAERERAMRTLRGICKGWRSDTESVESATTGQPRKSALSAGRQRGGASKKVRFMLPAEAVAAAARVKEELIIEDHFQAAEHLFRYLKGTMYHGLRFSPVVKCAAEKVQLSSPEAAVRLEIYADADLMGDPVHGKSTTGWVLLVNGQPVHWCSKKQTLVARSTRAAEYVATAMAIDEAKWLSELLVEVGFTVLRPTVCWGDNEANNSINDANELRTYAKMRGVALAYHLIRHEAIHEKTVELQRVSSEENLRIYLRRHCRRRGS